MVINTWESELLGITIEIDYDKCKGSGNCIKECPSDVFLIVNEKSMCLTINDCVECCACVTACPEGAIKHSSCLE